MAIFQQDLQIDQGQDFGPPNVQATTLPWLVSGAVQDLTNYTSIMEIWDYPGAATYRLKITNSPNGNGSSVAPQGTAGTVIITINNLDTLPLPANLGPLMYWLSVLSPASPGPVVKTLLQWGRILVNPNLIV
jgi:hypothetical protein